MKKSLQLARSLRHNSTEAERTLWRQLRNRRFAGFKFRRQVPLGSYVADFVCMSHCLVIELDGSQHRERFAEDAKRTHWLNGEGFRVVRIWNHEIWENQEAVEELIWKELHREVKLVENSKSTPHPACSRKPPSPVRLSSPKSTRGEGKKGGPWKNRSKTRKP